MRTLRRAVLALMCAALAACSVGGPDTSSGRSPATDNVSRPPGQRPPSARSSPAATGSPAAGEGDRDRTVQGVWASSDGALRLTLRRDGTFSEDYNGTANAYEGRYTLRGDALALSAATGESAEGTVGKDRIDLSGRELLPQR
ncbi:Atu4866 domain-containing protein [Streptomyces sp. NPDC102409]|uniref:Atu4866 domain-containing protein n=1 Tax=Streptomyces sp. NPDC102409 TaxID=3366172 RepID=UPI0038078EC5